MKTSFDEEKSSSQFTENLNHKNVRTVIVIEAVSGFGLRVETEMADIAK